MNLKRLVSIVAIAVLAVLMLTACAGGSAGNGGATDMVEENNPDNTTNESNVVEGSSEGNTIEEINANSNLPMALLTPHEEVSDTLKQDESLDFIDNFMSADYYADGYMISFAGFPEDDSPYCLTTIELTDSKYDIFGVKVGSDITQGAQKLEEHGFTPGDSYEFAKDDVVVSLSDDGSGIIEEISVDVPSAYTSGNLY